MKLIGDISLIIACLFGGMSWLLIWIYLSSKVVRLNIGVIAQGILLALCFSIDLGGLIVFAMYMAGGLK